MKTLNMKCPERDTMGKVWQFVICTEFTGRV